jgi:preprotein translocase subunit Sec63
MLASRLLVAKRALVKILLALAAAYAVGLNVHRDTSDADVVKSYRRAALKAHPDKGETIKKRSPVSGETTSKCRTGVTIVFGFSM